MVENTMTEVVEVARIKIRAQKSESRAETVGRFTSAAPGLNVRRDETMAAIQFQTNRREFVLLQALAAELDRDARTVIGQLLLVGLDAAMPEARPVGQRRTDEKTTDPGMQPDR